MAITITSKYIPLSFEDKIKPMMLYKAEYDSMMDKYDQLENEASKLAYIAQQYPDSDAALAYNQYIADLDAMATEMSQGLSPGYRKKYFNIYKRYGREITPMQQAYETILKNIENERALQAADNTRISTFSPQNIDDIINGVKSNQTVAVSGAKLTEEAANLATIYGKALKGINVDETVFTRIANLNPVYRTDANGNIMYDANGYPIIENLSKDSYRNEARFLMSEISNGLNPNSFSELISNIDYLKTKMPALYSMVESVRSSNNYNAFNDEQKKQFDARIAQGLYSALQEPSYQLHNNPDFMGYGQPELIEEQIMNYSRANKPKGASTSSSSSNGSSSRVTQIYDKPTLITGVGTTTIKNVDLENTPISGNTVTIEGSNIFVTSEGGESIKIGTIAIDPSDPKKVSIEIESSSIDKDTIKDHSWWNWNRGENNKKFIQTTFKNELQNLIAQEGMEGVQKRTIKIIPSTSEGAGMLIIPSNVIMPSQADIEAPLGIDFSNIYTSSQDTTTVKQ